MTILINFEIHYQLPETKLSLFKNNRHNKIYAKPKATKQKFVQGIILILIHDAKMKKTTIINQKTQSKI